MAKRGENISGWILGDKIGSGGQGDVFSANRTQQEGAENAALKIIKASHFRPKKRSRFIQEVSIHVALSSQGAPNIIRILDHNLEEFSNGEVKGYIAMPLAYASLEKVKKSFTGRIELCLEVFEGIVNGIRQAHAANVIHRDIKPGNILFMDDSLREPQISDFGICLLRETPDDERLTDVDETVGARYFMAPEQERGGVTDVQPNADIYALGKLLHHMLTGRYIYREELENAFSEDEMRQDPRLSVIHDKILSKTIIEDPESRLQTADELLEIVRGLRQAGRRFPSGVNPGHSDIPAIITGESLDEEGAKAQNSLKVEYERLKKALAGGRSKEVELEFDERRAEFETCWSRIHDDFRNSPDQSGDAASQLIREQPKATALSLAIARCDAADLFMTLKRFLEFITKSSEKQSGYKAVFTIPHVQAGFLYMATSVMALHFESWQVLEQLLSSKFEWYYESNRPLYSYGFDHLYFFHPEAMGREASTTHDFYHKELRETEVVAVTGLNDEALLNAYCQTQMLMSLRVAQLQQTGEDIRIWPDFGRYYHFRVSPLLDRMFEEEAYASGVLKSFGESVNVFFEKLNSRLGLLSDRLDGSGFDWASINQWEPR